MMNDVVNSFLERGKGAGTRVLLIIITENIVQCKTECDHFCSLGYVRKTLKTVKILMISENGILAINIR